MVGKGSVTIGSQWLAKGVVALCASLLLVGPTAGCSDDDDNVADAAVDASPDSGIALPLEIDCEDLFDDVYGDPGALPGTGGAILKCSQADALTVEDMQAELETRGYSGTLTSGAQVYRVTYETQRGNGDPGYSSALVLIPDTPRAAALPVIVASHGSFGQAAVCAPSMLDTASDYVRDDYYDQIYPLVGAGYAVIAPDLPGYVNYGAAGNPPNVYAHALDSGRATLDAVAAMRNLLGGSLSNDIVLAGHSLGGGSALAALAIAEDYGVEGEIVGVALWSPLWIAHHLAGAMLLSPSSFTVANDHKFIGVSVWYHYSHAALMEGPDHALDVFAPAVHDAVQTFVDNTCWGEAYPGLAAVATDIGDLYTPEYAAAIRMASAIYEQDCAGDPLCEKWMGYFDDDRPHLNGPATQVPILFNYGMQDPLLTPGLMACVLERLVTTDNATVSGCIYQNDDHNTILITQADYTSQWIAARTLGETEPQACAEDLSSFITADGTLLQSCTTPPPNY